VGLSNQENVVYQIKKMWVSQIRKMWSIRSRKCGSLKSGKRGLSDQENVGAPHLDFEMGETTKASPVLAVALAFLSAIREGNLLPPALARATALTFYHQPKQMLSS